MLHYGQRGLRIYRGTLSCEIDRGLAQVTLVKTARCGQGEKLYH